jgi:hypothetical protein
VELHVLFREELTGADDPWFLWLRYFAANRTVEFAPRNSAAMTQLSATLRFLSGNREQQAATLMLFAEALSHRSDAPAKLIAPFVANWIDPASLRNAIEAARKIGRAEHHYVSLEDNLLFWTFLHSVKVERSPPRLTVDLRELRKRAGAVLTMGFADEQEEAGAEDLRYVFTELQPVYREWDVREAELDKARPYFAEETLRSKIRPLEIVRAAREDRRTLAAPAGPVGRPALSLKQRGLSRS